MCNLFHLMRQALLAAMVLFSLPASAEVSAEHSAQSGEIIVTGIASRELAELLQNPQRLKLRVDHSPSDRSMGFKLTSNQNILLVKPSFKLKADETYVLSLPLQTKPIELLISVPKTTTTPPRLVSFSPSQSIIPANTLRLYLTFSQPMARGQALKSIWLQNDYGEIIKNPFLNLSSELWDSAQTRLTLLLDPGRIKQGVGPNQQVGAPLQEGERYRLIISGAMKSANGDQIGQDASAAFRVGAAERRAITLDGWQITTPPANSTVPFSIAFDRIMDRGAVRRMIKLNDPKGAAINGNIYSDGGGWSLSPNDPWVAGKYQLSIDRELEDVSGNTLRTAFDASAGTIGTAPISTSASASIDVSILEPNE